MGTHNTDPVAFIVVGGTISAAFACGVTTLGVDTGAQKLRSFVDAYFVQHDISYKIFEPFSKFSEDFVPEDWAVLLEQIERCVAKGYKRIVVTHGTDTLAFTAFAVSLYFAARNIRICFACAFIPAAASNTDAFQNMVGAIAAVRCDDLRSGVYVAYQKSPSETNVFRAQDLKPMDFDKTCFEGIYGQVAATVTRDGFVKIGNVKGELVVMGGSPPTSQQLAQTKTQIVMLPCYPGLTLTHVMLDPLQEALVVLQNFHTGSVPALVLRPQLAALKKTNPNLIVVSAAHPSKFVPNPYETTAALERDGLLVIYKDLMPHQIYVLAMCEAAKTNLYSALQCISAWRFSASTKSQSV